MLSNAIIFNTTTEISRWSVLDNFFLVLGNGKDYYQHITIIELSYNISYRVFAKVISLYWIKLECVCNMGSSLSLQQIGILHYCTRRKPPKISPTPEMKQHFSFLGHGALCTSTQIPALSKDSITYTMAGDLSGLVPYGDSTQQWQVRLQHSMGWQRQHVLFQVCLYQVAHPWIAAVLGCLPRSLPKKD